MHPCDVCGNEWPSMWVAAECCDPAPDSEQTTQQG